MGVCVCLGLQCSAQIGVANIRERESSGVLVLEGKFLKPFAFFVHTKDGIFLLPYTISHLVCVRDFTCRHALLGRITNRWNSLRACAQIWILLDYYYICLNERLRVIIWTCWNAPCRRHMLWALLHASFALQSTTVVISWTFHFNSMSTNITNPVAFFMHCTHAATKETELQCAN